MLHQAAIGAKWITDLGKQAFETEQGKIPPQKKF
jgi:hypothetical protein